MQNLCNTINKPLISILLTFTVANTSGQLINRHEADSMLQLLYRSKPDTSRIDILLKLAQFEIFKPGEYKQDLDSADLYIAKAKTLNAALKSKASVGYITLVEAIMAKERGQKDVAKKMVEQAISILSLEKNTFHLAQAYFELSDYYDFYDSTQLSQKIKIVDQAASLFRQSGNKERLGYSLKVLADLYYSAYKPDKAFEKLDSSLAAYQSIHYTQLQGVYALYGGFHYERGNYDKALYYELQALQSAQNSNDTTMNLCQINNVAGIILIRLGEKERAINYFKTSLQVAEKYNDNDNVLLLLSNITDTYNKMGKPEEGLKVMNNTPPRFLTARNSVNHAMFPLIYLNIYNNLKDDKNCQIYSARLLSAIKTHKLEEGSLNNAYHLLISYYLRTEQFKVARLYLKKIELISKAIGDPNRINQNNYLKFRLDTAVGNFRSAVYHILTYNKIEDSLFNETKSKQIKQLEVEYETEKKEDSIKLKNKDILVLNQQNQLQRTNLQKVNLLKNVTIGGILLLLIIIILLYRQYRLKQLNSRTISYKNEILSSLLIEKEWLLKEVHHRVKNNLQIMISLLNTQSKYLENDDAVKAIRESQERMNAISLIHQKLYQSDDTAFINIKEYIHELVEHIRRGFSGSTGIVFDLNIIDLQLDVAQAVPVGLILNEAISNTFKYAFPGKSSGMVSISITHSTSGDSYLLTIKDNGIGLPTDYDISKKASFGIRLIQGLSKQLGGTFHIESNNGVQIEVIFKDSQVKKLFGNNRMRETIIKDVEKILS